MSRFGVNNLKTILCICMIALIGLTGQAVAAEKWDMPCAYSAKNFISKKYIRFAELVTKNSGGKLEIVVHASGSLYKGSEIWRAVRSGQVPIGARYLGAHSNENPIFGLDLLPFLATNFEDAWKLYQKSKVHLDKALQKQRMNLLFAAPWPPQGLFAKKEINSLADMKGVKFRAYDATTTSLAKLMGAIPTKTEATEISQAFATGIAESMIASGAIGVFQKIWDYVDYFYKVNAWIPKSGVIVNKAAWEGLSDDLKKVVLDAAMQVEKEVWQEAPKITAQYNQTMAKNGMKVLEPSDELKSGFKRIGAQIAKDWAGKASEAGKNALKAYQAQ